MSIIRCHFLHLFLIVLSISLTVSGSYHFTESLPSIVWWTPLIYPHLDDGTVITCAKSRCVSTRNKKHKHKTDATAYMFYGTDFEPEDLPLPRGRHDIWALLHEESPMNNYLFSHSVGIQLFNYTSTFSRHSDYPLTTQFLPTVEYLVKRRPVATTSKNELRRRGFAPVLYIQSHCNIASDRDRYVTELMKYVDVDSYGSCLHNKDLPNNLSSVEMYDREEFFDFISQYKFHIAFENAICEDYMTEKLFRPLYVGSVPIYRGSPLVRDWEPSEKSVVLADDFEDPKSLANFIRNLDENDDLYNSYLGFKNGVTNQWLRSVMMKRPWGVNEEDKVDFIKGFECFVCDNIAKSKCFGGNPDGSSAKFATKKHMNCHQPRTSIETGILSTTDEWQKEDWVETYWFAFDQARAIHKMIENKENNSRTFLNYLMKFKYRY